MSDSTQWWRSAAIYQVYPRSFADGDGDGIGDLAGVRKRLPYLAGLGIDAIWFSPWYPSPMADAGYDVSDYCDIDPLFGTLAEAEALIAEAHAQGLRIIIDIVPNHCSDRHAWFQLALASPPGSPARDLFHFRDGVGDAPPNNWQSHFGGPAWTRVPDGQWYLHLFTPGQPDWNWENPEVRGEFERVLRFWLDRGVDGFRIDVADALVKAPGLPDVVAEAGDWRRPYSDQDGVHEIYRSWRRLMDEYPGQRLFVAEAWLPDGERFARYLRPDELHSAFNFPFLGSAWDAAALRAVIDDTLATHARVQAAPTWVLANHDVVRPVTRYGRTDTTYWHQHHIGTPTDLALGRRRARAAALLSTGLPGGVYVYQGEELGLWEVEDIPDELRQDPILWQSGGADKGRDGCRVPLPWSGDEAPFGFNDEGAPPWLPQPSGWSAYSVAAETDDPSSMLALYRDALRLRREFRAPDLVWLDSPEGVLAFRRGRLAVVINISDAPTALPEGDTLLTSGPLTEGLLPLDTGAWVVLPG